MSVYVMYHCGGGDGGGGGVIEMPTGGGEGRGAWGLRYGDG